MSDEAPPAKPHGRLDEFMDHMAAQRFFLTMAEARAAGAMLAEGFDFVEVAAFFQTSAWATFYRACLRDFQLPESPLVLVALREAYDLKLSPQAAAQSAVKAIRREAPGRSGSGSQRAAQTHVGPSSVALDLLANGREAARRRNWPAWMRQLVKGRDGSGSDPGPS